jgi:hypothetical protein
MGQKGSGSNFAGNLLTCGGRTRMLESVVDDSSSEVSLFSGKQYCF